MKRRHLTPPGLPDWSATFSQVVALEYEGLRHLYVSGQVGVDDLKTLVGDGSFEAQLDGAFSNLEIALRAGGGSWPDVVKLTVYVVNYVPAHASPIQRALSSRFAAGHLPALSLLGVAALADPTFLVEVEATAVVHLPSPAR
jgi:enamine deaminase RidA (YjgF/YER057c/UK114 family)